MSATESLSQTTALYAAVSIPLWHHCAVQHNLHIFDSEAFELWLVATASCREEIRRLERLLRHRESSKAITNDKTTN